MRPVRAAVSTTLLSDGAVKLAVTLLRLGEPVKEQALIIQNPQVRIKGELVDDLRSGLQVFGDEGIYVAEFHWAVDQNWFVPRSQIKDLKRQLEVNLALLCSDVTDRRLETALADLATTSPSEPLLASTAYYKLKVDRLEYLAVIETALKHNLIKNVSEVIFEPKKAFLTTIESKGFIKPLQEFTNRTGVSIRLALPTVIRAWDEPVLKKWLKDARDAGFHSYEVGNPGALALLKSWDLPTIDIASDFMLYAMNRQAVEFWQSEGVSDICLSIEDDWNDMQSLLAVWPKRSTATAILYKDTPLFVAESCSLTALHNGCPTAKVCGYRSLEIENSKGERFIVAHEGCKSIVYSKTAYSISGERKRLMAAGVQNFRVDFLTRSYAADDMLSILASIQQDQRIPETHPANFHGNLK
jgi:putative protease